jgi:hypothetical protein
VAKITIGIPPTRVRSLTTGRLLAIGIRTGPTDASIGVTAFKPGAEAALFATISSFTIGVSHDTFVPLGLALLEGAKAVRSAPPLPSTIGIRAHGAIAAIEGATAILCARTEPLTISVGAHATTTVFEGAIANLSARTEPLTISV